MMHTVAYELSGSEASLTALTPVPDGTVRVTGNDILVPSKMNNVAWIAATINSAVATLRAELQTPSLRALFNFDISPINNGLVFGSLPRYVPMWDSPLPLVETEPMDFFVQNGAAVMNRGIVTLCDGPIKPVAGKIFTIRATGSAALVTATWVNTSITFSQTLPFGTYQVVGFRAWGTNLVAARIFFVGSAFRPGVPAVNLEDNNEWPKFRYGNSGVWDQFLSLVPPTVDCLGVTDSSQVFFLDLIKTS